MWPPAASPTFSIQTDAMTTVSPFIHGLTASLSSCMHCQAVRVAGQMNALIAAHSKGSTGNHASSMEEGRGTSGG